MLRNSKEEKMRKKLFEKKKINIGINKRNNANSPNYNYHYFVDFSWCSNSYSK